MTVLSVALTTDVWDTDGVDYVIDRLLAACHAVIADKLYHIDRDTHQSS